MTSRSRRTAWCAGALGVTAVVCGLVLGDVVDPERVTAAATVAGAGIAATVHLYERRQPHAQRDNSNSPADSGELDASADDRP